MQSLIQRLLKLLIVVLINFYCAQPTYAGFLPAYDLPTLVRDADIIVVGRTGEIRPVKKATLETGGFNSEGKPATVDVLLNQVLIETKTTLKGVLPDKSSVTFPAPVSQKNERDGFPSFAFPSVPPSKDLLFFLKKTASPTQFDLLYPLNVYGSTILLSSVIPTQNESLSPLRKVLWLLSNELIQSNNQQSLASLERIKQNSPLVYINDNDQSRLDYSSDLIAFRKSLQEEGRGLENWISENIIPKIGLFIQHPNIQLRQQATLTLANLQNASVLPQLISLSEENSEVSLEASTALRQYRTPQSIKGLSENINHPQPSVRQQIAFALSSINERAIIPLFLRLLNDSDAKVRQYALAGLTSLIDATGPQEVAGVATSQSQYIEFWRDWAAKNERVVKEAQETLRIKFLKN